MPPPEVRLVSTSEGSDPPSFCRRGGGQENRIFRIDRKRREGEGNGEKGEVFFLFFFVLLILVSCHPA